MVPEKFFKADGCLVCCHGHLSGGCCRRLNLWFITRTMVSAFLVMFLQEDYVILWNAAQARERDSPHNMPLNHSAQTTAVPNNPEPFFLFLLLSHLHGFSQTWAKWCWRIHWGHFGPYRVPKNVEQHWTVLASIQHTVCLFNGIVILQ